MRMLVRSVIRKFLLCALFVPPAVAQETKNRDRDFLTKAMQTNVAQIELAKMAQSQSDDARIKQFANMLVKDDADTLNRLRQTASTLGIDIKPAAIAPTREQEDLKKRLAMLAGSMFDREYIDDMVQQHQRESQDFEAEASSQAATNSVGREKPAPSAGQAQAQTLARELLPAIKRRLQDAQSLEQQIRKDN